MMKFTLLAEREWRPIAEAPPLERVLLCGWQPKSRSGTAGYWWWHEGVFAEGQADELYPNASHWCYPRLPDFPTPPEKA